MAHRTDDIQQDIEDTQQDIADTRSAMTEKLELLGERVQETVEGAQASVEGIVENVKETVGETVEAVQRTFDLHHQMEQHPWLLLSGSLIVGYLLGNRDGGRTAAVLSTNDARRSPASPLPGSSRESSARPQPRQETGSSIRDRFRDEIALIEGAVIGAVISTLGDIVKQALLPPAPPITSARTKQGGQSSDHPVQTPVPGPGVKEWLSTHSFTYDSRRGRGGVS